MYYSETLEGGKDINKVRARYGITLLIAQTILQKSTRIELKHCNEDDENDSMWPKPTKQPDNSDALVE